MVYPRCCVLFSGGIESCVLVGLLTETDDVFPFRVHYGLRWEEEERAACERYLRAFESWGQLSTQPLTVVAVSVQDTLRPLWAFQGPVPSSASPDADVELPQRNCVLLEAAAAFCARQHIPRIAIGTLAGNPFSDATRAFFDEQERILSERYERPLQIAAPFQRLRKADVLRKGTRRALPLKYSLSCLNPLKGGIHCGTCNKCAERRRAFQEAGIADPTEYAACPASEHPPRLLFR